MNIGKPDPTRRAIGYRPKAGQPRDASGQLILTWTYEDEWPGAQKANGKTMTADDAPRQANAACLFGFAAEPASKSKCRKSPAPRNGGRAGRTMAGRGTSSNTN